MIFLAALTIIVAGVVITACVLLLAIGMALLWDEETRR
jgi:hypothetical protein